MCMAAILMNIYLTLEANTRNPEQTVPKEAVWTGYIVFAI